MSVSFADSFKSMQHASATQSGGLAKSAREQEGAEKETIQAHNDSKAEKVCFKFVGLQVCVIRAAVSRSLVSSGGDKVEKPAATRVSRLDET